MKRLLLVLLLPWIGFAQFSSTAHHIVYSASLPANCNPSTGDVYFKTSSVIGIYYCSAPNTWTIVSGAGSGPPTGTASGDLSGTYPGPNVAKINGVALSGLATGILKNATGTGLPSIAAAGTDYQAPISAGTGITFTSNVVSLTGCAGGVWNGSTPSCNTTVALGANGVGSGGVQLIGSTSGSSTLSVTATGTTLNLGSTNATVTTAGVLTVTSCVGCGGSANAVLNNQANTYTGGGLQSMSAVDLLLPNHASDPGTCTAGQIEFNTGGNFKGCSSANTWTTFAAGSTAAFGSITSGTNTTAAMLVGTGTSLGFTGSGTVSANNTGSGLMMTGGNIVVNTAVIPTFTTVHQNINFCSLTSSGVPAITCASNNAVVTGLQNGQIYWFFTDTANPTTIAVDALSPVSLEWIDGTTSLASGTIPANSYFSAIYNGTVWIYRDDANPFVLTTTGSSGAATFSGGVLNIPQYSGSSGSGTVNSGSINQLAWYAATGTAVSGLATAAGGVLITNSSSVPSISTTLPTGLVIPSPSLGTGSSPLTRTCTAGTGGMTAGLLVVDDGSGNCITAPNSTLLEIKGVAVSTVSASASGEIVVIGVGTCTANTTITAGHGLIVSGTSGRVSDSGTVGLTSLGIVSGEVGYAQAAATTGNTFQCFITPQRLGGTAIPLVNLSAATNNNNQITFPWHLTSNNATGLTIDESTASTGGTSTNQQLMVISTLAGSTAVPLEIGQSLTGSQNLPTLWLTPTWNTSAVVDAAILLNVTSTLSGTGSLLGDLQVNNTSQWKVDKAGNSTQLGTSTASAFTSTVSIGTAPFTVTSTTQVANLNAATLGGISLGTPVAGGIGYGVSTTQIGTTAALTQYGVLFSGGTGAPTSSAQGGSNFPLIGQGPANPIFSTIAYPTSLAAGAALYASTTTAIAGSITPTIGVAGTSTGTWTFANATGSGTFTLGASPSTTTNTILGPTAVIANGHVVTCTTSSTICTLTDGGAPGTGTVSSVSFTGGLISVATSTTTPALTVAGTSGGGVYFSGAAAWASTAVLAANVPIFGGGAGQPFATGLATGSTGTITSGHLACITASNTMGNCTGTPSNNFIGVFVSSTQYTPSGIVSVTLDATETVTFGDILCASTTAGLSHDNGSTSCANGEWVGIVTTTAGPGVSSATVSLRLQ